MEYLRSVSESVLEAKATSRSICESTVPRAIPEASVVTYRTCVHLDQSEPAQVAMSVYPLRRLTVITDHITFSVTVFCLLYISVVCFFN